ncbi:MAG TPA: hypothetical protein VK760_14460 [Candidatus Acidoferrales bacterium]|jgi:hypothetical protein|nr:hypothetical protein [Candidatus Acidoferrales bacterium]
MTRKELATVVGGLMIGAGCSAPAEKLTPPPGSAELVKPETLTRVTAVHVSLSSGGNYPDRCTLKMSPASGWSISILDPRVVEANIGPAGDSLEIKSKAPGVAVVSLTHPNAGTMTINVRCV